MIRVENPNRIGTGPVILKFRHPVAVLALSKHNDRWGKSPVIADTSEATTSEQLDCDTYNIE